jgi:hypothetical protein
MVGIRKEELQDAVAAAFRDMAQQPEGLLYAMGEQLFAPVFRMGTFRALDRFLAKAHHRLPQSNQSVGVQAVKLVERDPGRIQLLVANLGAATVYLGDSSRVIVGAAGDPDGGWPVFSNTAVVFDKIASEVWAISGTIAQDVRVMDLSG